MTSSYRLTTDVYQTGRSSPEQKWAHRIYLNGTRVAFGEHTESAVATLALKKSLQELQRAIKKALLSL